MILRKINYGEAILEPYFDGGDSDMRFSETRLSPLRHYTVTTDSPALCRVKQSWAGLTVQADGCREGGSTLEMRREEALDVSEYDQLILFAAIPKTMEAVVEVRYDGLWHDAAAFCGDDSSSEYHVPLNCKKLEGFGYRFRMTKNAPASAELRWLALGSTERTAAWEASRRGVYPADWEDHMRPDGTFSTELELWFDQADLEKLRKKVQGPALKPFYDRLCRQAEEFLDFCPEREIGTYIPRSERRWCRDRDMGLTDTSERMATLAFVGLMEQRADLSRMAVRMALSAANCEYWSEGPMGTLPGCPWHHRSFRESAYACGVALVLDWAGGFLTQYGKTVLLDAIAMKALPRMESDFRRMEYIRHMNQGIFFNRGRVTGLLALEKFFPRYDVRIREAEADLHEMIGAYVLKDGGTLEGPGYWNDTFTQAVPQLYLLSRWHKISFESYASSALLKTGAHALSLLSIQGRGNASMLINDSKTGAYSPLLMAAFARMSGDPDYGRVLAATLAEGNVLPSAELMVLMPETLPKEETLCRKGFTALPDLGQARIIREDPELGRISFHLMGGPAYFGHFHEDKGSFILETEHEGFAIDRGITIYSHPETAALQLPVRHNLCYPEIPGGAILHQCPDAEHGGRGARLVDASYEGGIFAAEVDVTDAWQDGFVTADTRAVISSGPGDFEIEDTLELTGAYPVIFQLHTKLPVEIVNGIAILRGRKADLHVEPVDWTPQEIAAEEAGIDGHLEPVNRLILRSAAANSHHLKTRLRLRAK